MDVTALLHFLNNVDPIIAEEIYQLAEDWPDKTPELRQSGQQSSKNVGPLNIGQ